MGQFWEDYKAKKAEKRRIRAEEAAEMARTSHERFLQELQEIIDSLKKPEVPIDDAIEFYKEGTAVSEECAKSLEEAEQEVLLLNQKSDGEITLTKFDGNENEI